MRLIALNLPGGYRISDPPGFKFAGGKIADVVNAAVPYVFGLVGFLLILYLVWGGFEWMTSEGNEENIHKAQGKITAAIVGFLIIFAAYWIVQILEVLLGIQLLKW